MSRFFTESLSALQPYVPGEQPQDMQYIKLNTNESPFPPAPGVMAAISSAEVERLYLYSDPDCKALIASIAKRFGLKPEQVTVGNGSDEVLWFALRAFCDEKTPLAYNDITYGCYKTWCGLLNVPSKILPLKGDYSIDLALYNDLKATVMVTNPNAPTGICLSTEQIEGILKANPDNVVIVDEAYVDFGGQSCVGLIEKYENLLVVQTCSKSRSLAGARLGYAMGSAELIADLNRIKFSFNPYNVNRLTCLAGIAAMEDEAYFQMCTKAVSETRERTAEALKQMGFTVTESKANFLFAESGRIPGMELYLKLKERGILVRHFDKPRLENRLRITVGSDQQMDALLTALRQLGA
ncbi:MAG: histidinol-phosphate transaminase [Clostridia bacterium]|nr:histidinol-phosphate transaminase [Clostridia bacterium]